MQDSSQGPTFAPEDFNFEALYQGKSPMHAVGDDLNVVPWDIGEPQPVLVGLEETGQLRSDILDAGCGLGDNALFLVERGYRVRGFDSAPTALERARERARARGIDLELVLADATRLEGFEQRFSTVLDSGLYHCLGDEQRAEYAAALHRVTQPGAQLHLFCFSDTDFAGLRMPNQVGQDDLRTHLREHWSIQRIEHTQFATAFTREFLERQETVSAALSIDIDALRTDGHRRVTVPAWHLHAARKDSLG